MTTFNHTTVLLNETVDGLQPKADGIYVDCTLGGAGHTAYLLEQLGPKGHVYAIDRDDVALAHAAERLAPYVAAGQVTFIKANFDAVKTELAKRGVTAVDGIVYDLGVSSPQLDQIERGFSYSQSAPLDMRMDQQADLTAAHILNDWPYQELVRIFYRYGEEKFSKQIARAIERYRAHTRLTTTDQLVDIIRDTIPMPARRTGGHPAKRVFQAIRIAVNDELGSIERSLQDVLTLLRAGGRISVISFHSLEDRLVKTIFKQASSVDEVLAKLPIRDAERHAPFQLITRKPIVASSEELAQNARAKSAKLRIIEKRDDR